MHGAQKRRYHTQRMRGHAREPGLTSSLPLALGAAGIDCAASLVAVDCALFEHVLAWLLAAKQRVALLEQRALSLRHLSGRPICQSMQLQINFALDQSSTPTA